MTFNEKREQVALAADIGRLLDGEGTEEELSKLKDGLSQIEGAPELLQQMSYDNRVLQGAVASPVPDESMARFKGLIDSEFAKRSGGRERGGALSWTGVLVQMAAALVLIAGTFAFTSHWMQSQMDQTVATLAAHMETERILLAQSVQEALETRVSGEPVYIGQEGDWLEVLTPIKTYKSKSGHWCRQYLRQTSFGSMQLSIRGTACRDENGTWTTVLAEPVTDSFMPRTNGI